MPSKQPTCESVFDDEEASPSSLVPKKSGLPSPPRYKQKPPSIHSDSGYSSKTSKTGLTSDSSSVKGRSSRPIARAESDPSKPLASSPSAVDDHVARVSSAPAQPVADHSERRFTLPQRPESTKRTPVPPPRQQTPSYPPIQHQQPIYYPPAYAPPPMQGSYPPPGYAPAPGGQPPSSFRPPAPTVQARPRPGPLSRPPPIPIPAHPASYAAGPPTPSTPASYSEYYSHAYSTPTSPAPHNYGTTVGGHWVYDHGPAQPRPRRSESVSAQNRRFTMYEPTMQPGPMVHQRRMSHHRDSYHEGMSDSRAMPPPSLPPPRPATSQPRQTLEMPYRPQHSRPASDERSDPAPPRSVEEPRRVKDATKPKTKTRSDATPGRSGAARKTDRKSQAAEDYMNAQSQKTSQELTDDELEKRKLSPKVSRTPSKSQRSRADSARSYTESERERQQTRIRKDGDWFVIDAAEGAECSISYDGDKPRITVGGSRSRYHQEGTATSKGSRSTYAEHSRASRKRDSVVDMDNTKALAKAGAEHSP